MSLPARWLWVVKALGGMRLLRVLVFAHERVRVLLLIEVAEGVVNLSMLALVCTDCFLLVPGSWMWVEVLTVKEQIAHGSVTLRHLPVVDGDLGSLQLFPFW